MCILQAYSKLIMTFNEQLYITLIDKAAIGLLLLVAGFLLNKVIENYKSKKGLENEFAKLRDAKRLDFLEKQLSQFYYPIYMRLQVDNVVWERILDRRNGEDELRRKVGEKIEEKLILPNHDDIVKIMQSNVHLAAPDSKLFQVMLQYIRHVAVYKSMRESECYDKDPLHLGEPWPSKLLPMIKNIMDALQQEYNKLADVKPLDITEAKPSSKNDAIDMLNKLAVKYRNINVIGFSRSVNMLNEIANELGEFVVENGISKLELAEMARDEGNEGLFAALVSSIIYCPEKDDLLILIKISKGIRKRHIKYRIVEAFVELHKLGLPSPEQKSQIGNILNIYEHSEEDMPFLKQIGVCREVINRKIDSPSFPLQG